MRQANLEVCEYEKRIDTLFNTFLDMFPDQNGTR